MALTPAAIAGLTTGSIGFAITLYKTSLDVYTVFATASSLGEDVQVLEAQFLIQETLFRRWGEGLGLSKGSIDDVDERLKEGDGEGSLFQAVILALSSVKKVLSNVEDLRKLYGVEVRDERTVGNQMLLELQSMSLIENELVRADYDRREEEAVKMQKRVGIMKKLKWIIKDKEKFEKLLERLTKLNDGLYSLISPLEASILAKAVAGELLKTVELKWLEVLKEAARATSNAKGVANLAGLRHRAIQIMNFPNKVPDMELPDRSKGLIMPSTRFYERRTLGTYQPKGDMSQKQPVLVEWKAVDASVSGTSMKRFNDNLNQLAYFLNGGNRPEYLRSLPCIGVTKPITQSAEMIRYGLVYSLAERRLETKELPMLSTMLESNENEPDLGDKFCIAQILVQSVHELHLANWLHKAISSDNIIIVLRQDKIGKASHFSSNSVFLAGYESSRPGRLRDPTEPSGGTTRSAYTHPDYDPGQVKYRRWFDIYSLGVVLLEIGLWQRAAASIRPGRNPSAIRDLLVESCDELGPAMGRIYRDAVRACLTLDFGVDLDGITAEVDESNAGNAEELMIMEAKDDQMNSDLTASFYWRVVQPLRKLFA